MMDLPVHSKIGFCTTANGGNSGGQLKNWHAIITYVKEGEKMRYILGILVCFFAIFGGRAVIDFNNGGRRILVTDVSNTIIRNLEAKNYSSPATAGLFGITAAGDEYNIIFVNCLAWDGKIGFFCTDPNVIGLVFKDCIAHTCIDDSFNS